MVEIAAFRGLRYDQAVSGPPQATSAPGYEDLAPTAYAAHRTANPYTVLELVAPGQGGYAAAGETLQRWLRTGVLVPEAQPVLYRYEQHELRGATPAVQRGVLAAVRVERLGTGVLAHEGVDAERLEERRRRLEMVPVDLSPVFTLTTRPVAGLHGVLERPPHEPPVIALTDEAGTDHRIWALADPADHRAVQAALADVPVMIADGHHRYAAALAAGATHTLAYVVDPFRHGPRVRAIHRLVEPVTAEALARLGRHAAVEPHTGDLRSLARRVEDADVATFGLVLADGTRSVLTVDGTGGLDTEVLHDTLLPVLGPDLAVAYRVDLAEAAAELDRRGRGGLFVLRPAGLHRVLSLALAGELLPPKTTSFAPKPRTGLVLRLLAE